MVVPYPRFMKGGYMEDIRYMSIDIETYCGVDLARNGVYRYAESDDFEILLFGVSVNGGPVEVYDLTRGDSIPEDILGAIVDEDVLKWAYNASFERVCISSYLRRNRPDIFRGYGDADDATGGFLDPHGWRCSRIWGAYMGLPLSLDGIGRVLKLTEGKMKEGASLIQYFCRPCRPTLSNGGRTRNLPSHAMDKWKVFTDYNRRDVEVEMAVQEKLSRYPVPDFLWDEYVIDQTINDRGILVDMELVGNAVSFDERSRETLMERLRVLTDLENPNSVVQMKSWLSGNGVEVDTLGKKAVKALIPETDGEVRDALVLRLQVAKSSVKKYKAMEDTVCGDGRARGCFQFYGASRSGRWAGRHIQLQNLPQNHIERLAETREIVKGGDYEMLQTLYDDIPDVLSQLIRTAFIPREGTRFIVADFSAIEARVLAFLAGEEWRNKVFRDNGDIYCASASAMFKVPVEKHGVNGHLRQKGKVAELACIAEGQMVLTDSGEKPIETVTDSDLLWDGEDWVRHEGVIYKGEGETIEYQGLRATPDHYVWVEGEQRPLPFGFAAGSGFDLVKAGHCGHEVRTCGDNGFQGTCSEETSVRRSEMHGLRECKVDFSGKPEVGKIEGVPGMLTEETGSGMAVEETDGCKAEMRESERQELDGLRWQRDKVQVRQRTGGGTVCNPGDGNSSKGDGTGQDRHRRGLCKGEPAVRHTQGEQQEQKEHGPLGIQPHILALLPCKGGEDAVGGYVKGGDHQEGGDERHGKKEELAYNQRKVGLYDIRNAGPNHRFTVSGHLVHNCGYGGGTGALKAMGALEMGLDEGELEKLIKDWRASNPHITEFWWGVDKAAKEAIKTKGTTCCRGIRFEYRGAMLFIHLPSGRRLTYVKPRIGENRFGGESIDFEGIDQEHKWGRIETYGPKLVENIVQAVSRDILANAMKNLRNMEIVAHVHDELIIQASPGTSVEEVCRVMGMTPPWIEGLQLRADGYETEFYRKD